MGSVAENARAVNLWNIGKAHRREKISLSRDCDKYYLLSQTMSGERMRLQKFLSQAEVCSRRKAEELIADGKVRVNGKVAALGQSVVVGDDVVKIGNRAVTLTEQKSLVLMLNKPRGYLCTNFDSGDGNTVFDLIPEEYSSRKLFCVGRLDKDSEGLLLITNNGELANKIIHPSSGIVKRYEVVLNREFDPALTPRLLKGAKLQNERGEDEYLRFSNVIRFPDGKKLEIHLNQGRKREIRRLLEVFGFFVKKLRRFQIGGLIMKRMPIGDCRKLSKKEIDLIFSQRGTASGGRHSYKAKLHGENVMEPSKAFKRESWKFEKFKEREAMISKKVRIKRDVRRAARAEKLATDMAEGEGFSQNHRHAPVSRGNVWAKEVHPHIRKTRTRSYSSRKGVSKKRQTPERSSEGFYKKFLRKK